MKSRSDVFRRHRTICSFGLALALAATAAQGRTNQKSCPADSKLIGLIELSTVDAPGTWWNLTRSGMVAAGIDDESEQLATMQVWFGVGFNTLPEAVAYLVDQVRPIDANGNGYVCAYSLRGTRTGWGDPNFAHYLFKVDDDR
jgi:hypothetical protein